MLLGFVECGEVRRFCLIQAGIHCDLANWQRQQQQQISETEARKALSHCNRALQLIFQCYHLMSKKKKFRTRVHRKRQRDGSISPNRSFQDDQKRSNCLERASDHLFVLETLKAEAYVLKSRVFIATNRYQLAIDALQKALCIFFDPAIVFLLASCHKRLGNSRDAIPLFSSILSYQFKFQFASYLHLGKCLSCVGQNEAAIRCYENSRTKFFRDTNQSALWHFHFGEFLGNLKLYSAALPYIMEALRLFFCTKSQVYLLPEERVQEGLFSPYDQPFDEEEGPRWLAYGLAISYNSLLCKRKTAANIFYQLQNYCNFDETLIACAFVPYQSLLIDMSVSLAVNIAQNAAHDFELAATFAVSNDLTLSQKQILMKCEFFPEITLKHRPRIGYVSSDFNRHCIGDLLLHVFRYHKSFEVFAFSTSNTEDSHQHQIKTSVDYFFNISALNCTEAAFLIRSFDIDVLVDLNGYTQGCRTLLFALRCARLQISWLGYPGTSGASFIDMIVVDPFIISASREQFTEKLFVMPYTYQVNSHRTTFSSLAIQPEIVCDFFNFVNYNRLEKIDEGILQTWIRILKRSPRARLHLLASPVEAVAGIKTELADVENQIIWAQPCSPENHMVRLSQAHALLDTHIYNSHTSASDALWAGVPIITYPGVRMHSRVAASLVTAIGCGSTMIVESFDQYEDRAVFWAQNLDAYDHVRKQLCANRESKALFRPDLWIQDFENGLSTVLEKPEVADVFVLSGDIHASD